MSERPARVPAPPLLDPHAELEELKRYLGNDYEDEKLWRHKVEVDEELARLGGEHELYRTSRAYLYDLTVFAMSGTKDPYLRDLMSHVPPGSRLLDYGCGIGSDGLRLIEAGYEVAFADFANPSVDYLRWRLHNRGLEASIFDLDRDRPSGFDVAYAFDVIEHVDDPFSLLELMEWAANGVFVNLLETDEDETPLHHRLPIRHLLRHAASRRLVLYRVYHGRSHLVFYERPTATAGERLRSELVLASGRLRKRIRPG